MILPSYDSSEINSTYLYGGDEKMSKLSDDLLIKTYFQAIDLELSPEFIKLLEKEIRYRFLQHYK